MFCSARLPPGELCCVLPDGYDRRKWMAGIRFREPIGPHDGTLLGHRFDC